MPEPTPVLSHLLGAPQTSPGLGPERINTLRQNTRLGLLLPLRRVH